MTKLKEQPALARFQLPENMPPVYQGGTSLEEHADTWETVEQSLQNHYWYLGAIAASLDTGYGRGSIKELAAAVRKSPERIYQLLRTYRAFEGQPISPELWFTHYQYAAESDDPPYWIRRALDEGLSTRKLEELIKGKQLPDFRIKEEEPVQDAEFQPVTSNGYGPFPPDELVTPEPHDDPYREEQTVDRPPKRPTLQLWYSYVVSFPCLNCGASDVEVAHIEAALSNRTSGWLPRRTGLSEWTCVPACAHCHRTGPESIHAIGEDAWCENVRSIKFVHDWLTTRLLEFFTQDGR